MADFDTPKMNNSALYDRVSLTGQYLVAMSDSLSKYNNILAGSHINVTGNKNLVIGSYNDIQGSNNWVFAPNFKGNITGDLVMEDWRI